MFKKQAQHIVLLLLLVSGVYFLASGDVLSGQLWGVSTPVWLWIAVATPILHQMVVAFVWRAELYHHKISEWLGEQAFPVYRAIFTILFVGRAVTLILLGSSNANTLPLNPAVAYVVAAVLLVPFTYTIYSVLHYFGIARAYGEDHFKPGIYRNKPFVKQGIFRYTNNAMYIFGFLGLWAVALAFLSKAALLAALFNHLYIWVHFYSTELPDIQRIYGDSSREAA